MDRYLDVASPRFRRKSSESKEILSGERERAREREVEYRFSVALINKRMRLVSGYMGWWRSTYLQQILHAFGA